MCAVGSALDCSDFDHLVVTGTTPLVRWRVTRPKREEEVEKKAKRTHTREEVACPSVTSFEATDGQNVEVEGGQEKSRRLKRGLEIISII
jgi:hypothetical protein